MRSNEGEVLLGSSDVSRELDVAESDVRAWCRADGAVPRVGGVYVFRSSDVERLRADLDDEDETDALAANEDGESDEDEDEDESDDTETEDPDEDDDDLDDSDDPD